MFQMKHELLKQSLNQLELFEFYMNLILVSTSKFNLLPKLLQQEYVY